MYLVKCWRFLVGNGDVVDGESGNERRVVNICREVEYHLYAELL